jgi:hypothetical protein
MKLLLEYDQINRPVLASSNLHFGILVHNFLLSVFFFQCRCDCQLALDEASSVAAPFLLEIGRALLLAESRRVIVTALVFAVFEDIRVFLFWRCWRLDNELDLLNWTCTLVGLRTRGASSSKPVLDANVALCLALWHL